MNSQAMTSTPQAIVSRRRCCWVVMALCLCAAPTSLWASIEWNDLEPLEQQWLAPYQKDWADLDDARQERLRRGVRRWMALSDDEQQEMLERFASWQSMSAQQRQRARQRYRQFRSLPARQQRQLRAIHQRYKSLPAAERQQLRERFMSSRQQGDQGLRPLIRHLSIEQRRALRGLSSRMPADERQAMAKLIRQTPASALPERVDEWLGLSDQARRELLLNGDAAQHASDD